MVLLLLTLFMNWFFQDAECLNCIEFKNQFSSEEQSGFIGNTFLVSIETAEVTLFWDNMCFPQRINIHFEVSSATDGLSAFNVNNGNDIIVRNIERNYDGVIILKFIEQVYLRYVSHVNLYWTGNILPSEKLATEYLLVFPNVVNLIYICRIYSTESNTDISSKIISPHNSTSVTNNKHLDVLGVFTIVETYDFTGSRILASKNISVFCNVLNSKNAEQWTPYQLLPSTTSGKTFHIYFWSHFIHHFVRLIATRYNTTITVDSTYVEFLHVPGEISDISTFQQFPATIISDKPIFAYLMGSAMRAIFTIPSVEQYIKMAFETLLFPEIQIVYFMPSESKSDITVEISPVDHWQLMPAGYVFDNVTSLEKLTMHMMRIVNDESPGYYFLSSNISFGGNIFFNSNGRITSYFIGSAILSISQGCRLINITGKETLEDSCVQVEPNKETETETEISRVLVTGFSIIGAVVICATVVAGIYLKKYQRIRRRRIFPERRQ